RILPQRHTQRKRHVRQPGRPPARRSAPSPVRRDHRRPHLEAEALLLSKRRTAAESGGFPDAGRQRADSRGAPRAYSLHRRRRESPDSRSVQPHHAPERGPPGPLSTAKRFLGRRQLQRKAGHRLERLSIYFAHRSPLHRQRPYNSAHVVEPERPDIPDRLVRRSVHPRLHAAESGAHHQWHARLYAHVQPATGERVAAWSEPVWKYPCQWRSAKCRRFWHPERLERERDPEHLFRARRPRGPRWFALVQP